jgi:hypothetical protein
MLAPRFIVSPVAVTEPSVNRLARNAALASPLAWTTVSIFLILGHLKSSGCVHPAMLVQAFRFMVLCEEVLSRKVGHKEWESRMLKHMVFTLGKSRDKVWHISMNGNVAEVQTTAFPGNPHGQALVISP